MHRHAAWFLQALLLIAATVVAGCGSGGAGTPAATSSAPSSSVDTKKFWDERDRAAPGAH